MVEKYILIDLINDFLFNLSAIEDWAQFIIRLIDGIGSTEMLHIFAVAHGGPLKEGRQAKWFPIIARQFWMATGAGCLLTWSAIWPFWDSPGIVT
ncbi:hypothetical protein [Burkholderia pyrrocinia]|uniref:hypothetical protein n=1 Tax=Burkholderia pyrrocinia TaxID=60550 RepID=UPI001A9DEFDA|nr:hypothetical protein [Burkholderia pyrrocinia]